MIDPRPTTTISIVALLALVSSISCNVFAPDPFVPVEFDGLYEFKTSDGALTLRAVFEDGYVTKFVDDNQEKSVLNSVPLQQGEGRVNYVGYSGMMRPYPERAVEQWNIYYSGNWNEQIMAYEGTLVLRLTASTKEFAIYAATFAKVPD